MIKLEENGKHYFKNEVEFYKVVDIYGKKFMLASYKKRDKIVHSEEEAYKFFKISVQS